MNRFGFIETPYRKVDKATGRVTDEIEYMTADVEDQYIVCQAAEAGGRERRLIGPVSPAAIRTRPFRWSRSTWTIWTSPPV